MTDKQLLEQALEALEHGLDYAKGEQYENAQRFKGYEHLAPDDAYAVNSIEKAITAIRARLEQPEQEPASGNVPTFFMPARIQFRLSVRTFFGRYFDRFFI